MKIALVYDAVYPYVVGGAEHRYYALAQRWRDEHEVSIYGLAYWGDGAEGHLENCRYIGVGPPVPLYDEAGRRRKAEAFYFARRLVRPLIGSDDDIWDVSSFPYLSVMVARLIALIRRKPLVVTWLEYWDDYWFEYAGRWGTVGRLVERCAAMSSPFAIAISERTRCRMIASGYPADRVVTIPIGINLKSIDAIPQPTNKYDLVYAGRLVAHKQIDLLIRAASILKKGDRSVRVCILGDGPERARLTDLATRLKVDDCVTFLGRVPHEADVFGWMKAGRVLVNPSRREGFGMSIVEGWACGLPAVICNEPLNAMVDLIDEPSKGRIVPSKPEAIAAACADLLATWSEEGRTTLRRTADAYCWERIAHDIVNIYKRLTSGSLS